MTPEAIAKLRRTFILIATASFFVVITFMGVMTAAINVITTRQQADNVINMIAEAGGDLPSDENTGNSSFNQEAMYGLRYFVVFFDERGQSTGVNLEHITLVDAESALEVAEAAPDPNKLVRLSRYKNYYYKEIETSDGSMIVFLDYSFQIENMQNILTSTLLISVLAFIVTLISIMFFSKRAIRVEIENVQSQQRFMTNASHELKTPIAVIRANTEVTEMISGETEWTQSTLAQVDRLDRLVRDLMTIVRGEEKSASEQELAEIDVTGIVGGAVDSFNALAHQNGISLTADLEDGVKLRGKEASIEQLTCLLLDNATKYCDEGGNVTVSLAPARIGHGCTLVVSNDYADGADVDYRRFFDRFYREDESHENQQGYGIGLSVAESICKRYHGSIKASWKAGVISFTCNLKDA